MSNVKQVIVIRKDLNMRKGKMIAQGAHTSLKCFLSNYTINKADEDGIDIEPSQELEEWYIGDQTKIVLYVESEEELLKIYEEAEECGLNTHLVKDKGYTEFNEPTYTAVGIGPDESDKIDEVTGDLPLL